MFATTKIQTLLSTVLLACCVAPLRARAQTTHHIKTVFIILMENHNWSSIKGNAYAPYINKVLLPKASYAERYYNPPNLHPSLPNYLWLEAGTNFNIYNDGSPWMNHQSTTEHLVTLLKNARISWKAYEESISGTTCPLGDSYPYVAKHDPFVYFDDVTAGLNSHSSYCISHVRPFTQLASDLASGNVAAYNFITPNLCHDMHDSCGGNAIQNGDTWLSQHVPAILNSAAYRNDGALFITWDEGVNGDGPIGMIVRSPFAKGNSITTSNVAGGGYHNVTYYDHGSTLRTFEEIFGLIPLLNDANRQHDLRDLFTAFP